jgi:cytochrome P450
MTTSTAQTKLSSTPIPGPRPAPLIGNFPEMRPDGLLGAMARNFTRHGDLFRLRLGKIGLHVISSPTLAQDVLVDRNALFPKNEGILRLILGNGLVTNNDHTSWLVQRRMMQPMFHRARLQAMGDKISAATARMMARLEGNAVTDISFEMMEVTLDIITQVMFSADVLSKAGQIGPAVSHATHFVQHRLQNPIKLPLTVPLPSHTRFLTARETLYAVIHDLIAARRAIHEQNLERPGDLLDMLLEARDADTGEAMSDPQLRDEVLTIFAAGHETTAHTLSFAFAALAQHPDIQARLHAELDTVLGGRAPTTSDLERLPYTAQVLNETLRLYPAAPVTSPRQAAQATQVGSYDLPAGALILPSIFNIHRHPEYWPDPLEFNPERWEKGFEPAHRLAFMPFGAGPRKCIGNNLALMEGQLILASLAQQYSFKLEPGQTVQLEQAVTLRPKGGLKMHLEPRAQLL